MASNAELSIDTRRFEFFRLGANDVNWSFGQMIAIPDELFQDGADSLDDA